MDDAVVEPRSWAAPAGPALTTEVWEALLQLQASLPHLRPSAALPLEAGLGAEVTPPSKAILAFGDAAAQSLILSQPGGFNWKCAPSNLHPYVELSSANLQQMRGLLSISRS